ncbi:MAG TPA: dienelactone hydrolase family protein [Actinophytocola sp.]|jgi:carboxymethylenebutenolidase|uniref:dienelactone hydrolase family protein n=1 Tax=Actinophytocola sp. TaxID=1872138 RepID=UPI002F92027B
MADGMEAGSVTVTGAGGDEIEAYAAHPVGAPPSGGVVVIHHMPGYDESTKEITRKFASWGWSAACPNLHQRDAPGADPDDAAAACRAAGGVPDERLLGDVEGAAAYLRDHASGNGRVATIGFCSGGRQSVLAGCGLEIDAVIDCYGAFVLTPPPAESPMKVEALEPRLGDLSCPLLGLFGNDDKYPTPDEVKRFGEILSGLGKEHEFHAFDGAGHAFFAVDRPAYRPEAAVEGWRLVREFLGRHL